MTDTAAADAEPLPYAFGGPALSGVMRAQPEDFLVVERLGFVPSGAGEHVLLLIEKREANTEWVARQLARFAGVAPVAVGFAGLKDRHAITRQHFTVQLPGKSDPDWSALACSGVRVLSATRHARKLPRGALDGNDFELLLRGIRGAQPDAERVLARIAQEGVPNYFGEQRFGRDGGNLAAARAMFAGARVDRTLRSILLSAARSALFNAVLAQRVAQQTWNRLADGDVAQLDGTGSIFGPVEVDPELLARCLRLDLHPTGPLWGRGTLRVAGAVQALEQSCAALQDDFCAGLEGAGLNQERRALRVRVSDLRWSFEADALRLRFGLPAGAYATTVLREVMATTNGPDAAASGQP